MPSSACTMCITSFRRLHGWQEFNSEIKAWYSNHEVSYWCASIHHSELPNLHRHICSSSAAYLRCQRRCRNASLVQKHPWQRLSQWCQTSIWVKVVLRQLNAYDHLRQFYGLCAVHFKRKRSAALNRSEHVEWSLGSFRCECREGVQDLR
ncbi:hypothetical protein BDR03DRAFT_286870 [Suillus americanus]|nr:hypothetical protein BDR03DRAFT_286870 [Suillus americanus]